MSNLKLKFEAVPSASDPNDCPVTIIGQLRHLLHVWSEVKVKLEPRVTEEVFNMALSAIPHGNNDVVPMYLNRAVLCALPSRNSRHNTASRAHAITKMIKSNGTGGDECFMIVCERRNAFASACGAGRAFPIYTRKTGAAIASKRTVTIQFVLVGEDSDIPLTEEDLDTITHSVYGIRLAAKLVDSPTADMTTDIFTEEIKKVADELEITPIIIKGEELEAKGFGGLWNVGKAAVKPPALVVLSHKPAGAQKNYAWVGKGIVYDTGGLCIKSKTGMPGMKRDCGGAAAVLGAFYAAVKCGFEENLHALFCMAENAIGPTALRPDDIITLYSGRTVEVNNTDAEGRLVLGDGVAYAHRDLKADLILDMATLTGAQGSATGRSHAAILCNQEEWEQRCVVAGQNSGDLVHPLPYCPELHFSEFGSAVADMKNSVANRDNAQSSCAGLFIGSHIGFDWKGSWIHVDIASPVHIGERATGYGVALLCTLFGKMMKRSSLLQSIGPQESLVFNGGIAENDNKRFKQDN